MPLPQPLLQRPNASCPLEPLFPFTSVCWPVVVLPLAAPPLPYNHLLPSTAASHVYPRPPLFVCDGWLLHCILLHHLRLLKRHRLTSSLPSLALTFLFSPLLMLWPLPASSNAGCTLPAMALPTATALSGLALVLQHVCLCYLIVLFAFANKGRTQHNKTEERKYQDDGGTCNVEPQNLSVKFTLICESWSTMPRGPPRLT
jgi:hypothetical protein